MFETPLSSSRHRRPRRTSLLGALVLTLLAFLATLPALPALAADTASGLPLPRFATTRSSPINVRVGPGTRYDIAWVYVRAGTPVEIIQEFDTWRKIRDVDGSEGWVHQNLLSGRRAGIAVPWQADSRIPLLSRRGEAEGVRAFLVSGFRVDIARCDGTWCEVSATADAERGNTYSGFLPQTDLWGVYAGEQFN